MTKELKTMLETLVDEHMGNERVLQALGLYLQGYEIMAFVRRELYDGCVVDYRDNLQNPDEASTIHLVNAIDHILSTMCKQEICDIHIKKALRELEVFQMKRSEETE